MTPTLDVPLAHWCGVNPLGVVVKFIICESCYDRPLPPNFIRPLLFFLPLGSELG